jgi:hypothetical protein
VSASIPNGGQVSATADLVGADLSVHITGFGSGAGAQQFDLNVRVLVDVPQLGGPTSPVYIGIDSINDNPLWRLMDISAGYYSFPFTCSDTPITQLPQSTMLGMGAGNADFVVGQYKLDPAGGLRHFLSPLSFPAGDHVEVSLFVPIVLEEFSLGGPIDATFKITFRTTTPAIGNGDMNGDHLVNVLDSTLLRRQLAGFPIN